GPNRYSSLLQILQNARRDASALGIRLTGRFPPAGTSVAAPLANPLGQKYRESLGVSACTPQLAERWPGDRLGTAQLTSLSAQRLRIHIHRVPSVHCGRHGQSVEKPLWDPKE